MIKNIFAPLRSFLSSPIFPLLTFILFVGYIIYFEPVAFCDDGGYSLYNLKVNLTYETTRYRTAIVNYEHYADLWDQLMGISRPRFRNFSYEQELATHLENSRIEMRDSLLKVRELENTIRVKEPQFRSAISINTYLRVGRG
jgi:hypothetical protein